MTEADRSPADLPVGDPNRLRDAMLVVVLALLVIAFWKLRILDPADDAPFVRNLGNVDFFTYIVPVATGIRDAWLSGEVPLWNPYQGAGHPALATLLPGSFYPFNLPYLLFAAHVAVEVVAVLHLAMGAAFMFMLARAWGLERVAALVSATTFVLSGFLVSQANWFLPALAASVWLPAGLLAVERIRDRGGSGWIALLAAAVAMPVLAGWLQLWTYSMYALGLYAGFHCISVGRSAGMPTMGRLAALLGLGAALGIGLAAVQLLPSFELQALSPRRTGSLSTSEMMLFGGNTPGQLVQMATHAIVGPPRAAYLGIPALILIPLSLLARGPAVRLAALWSILVLGAGVALTVHTQWGRAFFALPSANWFREPQRILFLYAFAGSALAGIGMHGLASLGREAPGGWRIPLAALALAALLTLTVDPPGSTLALLGSVVLLVSAGCLVRSASLRRAAYLALAILAVVDPFVVNQNTNRHPFHDPEIASRERGVFEYLRARQGLDRSLLLGTSRLDFTMMPKHGTLEGIYSIADYEPLSLARRAGFFELLEGREGRHPTRPFSGWLDPDVGSSSFGLLDLMSVRFLVVHHLNKRVRAALEARRPVWSLARPRRGGDFVVYENPGALPRAYVAYHALAASNEEEALQAIAAEGFDARQVVVLEGPSAGSLPTSTGRRIEEAEVERYDSRRVVVHARLASAGILVLTDTAYPGWEVFVDGQESEILTANTQFRGVLLEPGKHRVEFVYRPTSFSTGAAISLLAIAGILFAARYLTQRR